MNVELGLPSIEKEKLQKLSALLSLCHNRVPHCMAGGFFASLMFLVHSWVAAVWRALQNA